MSTTQTDLGTAIQNAITAVVQAIANIVQGVASAISQYANLIGTVVVLGGLAYIAYRLLARALPGVSGLLRIFRF